MLAILDKELMDAVRDRRALLSSLFYCLMGPGVVWLVSRTGAGQTAVLVGMISVFALVAAFSGSMNLAMDVIAGERERKSLAPLLANPIAKTDVIVGKWLAVMAFALAGLLLCLFAFHFVHAPEYRDFMLVLLTGLIPLAGLTAAFELFLSTLCSNLKEAHTYLSMAVFLPMLVGMFGVFFPQSALWYQMLPIAGHHLQLERWLRHEPLAVLPSVAMAGVTFLCTAAILLGASRFIEREHAVFGR